MDASVLAGIASTLLFAGSMLPMVVRAWRTRDLASYSRSHLVMTNIGNAIHTVYVISLPGGPIWLLHGFHVVVASVMLVWHLRFAGAGAADECAERVAGEKVPAVARLRSVIKYLCSERLVSRGLRGLWRPRRRALLTGATSAAACPTPCPR